LNRPAGKGFREMMIHESEKNGLGWKVPIGSPTHFLNFPLGKCKYLVEDLIANVHVVIVQLIFNHLLNLPRKAEIWPDVLSKNQEFFFRRPTWSNNYDIPRTLRVDCRDEKGSYKLLRILRQPVIDATFLRTCKAFLEIGGPMLYSLHEYAFYMQRSSGMSLRCMTGENIVLLL
jgi:hypothetical protein